MSPLIPLVALLLALPASPQVADVASKSAAIAPIVGEDVAIVVHLDLARWQVPASFRQILGKLTDDPDVAGIALAIDGRVDALKKAGATDLFLLVDPTDMPGYPVAVVPLLGGVDARAVAEILTSDRPGSPVRWPSSETIRGALVAGSRDALARAREAKPGTRPELAAALASAGDSAVRIAVNPTIVQRRAIEESFPTLASEVGGGPIESVTRGMAWASIAMSTDPRATLRLTVRARDAESAKGLRKIAQDALRLLTQACRSDPAMADFADAVARIKPELDGDSVRMEADVEMTVALISVPIFRANQAARRSECVDNLKQIGLGMHNYLSTYKAFPAAYVAGKEGKPLLSWRVLILPYLEQKALFDQFHLDEPWDSPHNKPLIGRMPRVYVCPAARKALAAEGKTTYLVPRGPATVFPGSVGLKFQDITDGSSNTILVVDADDEAAVIWTKPDDWSTAPGFTIQGLFGHHPLGTNFTLADGSVRFLKRTIKLKLLQAMTTRNAGEVLGVEDQ